MRQLSEWEMEARFDTIKAKPELVALYHNSPTVHAAVRLWISGQMERGDAYEHAMMQLATQCESLAKQLVDAERNKMWAIHEATSKLQ